MCMTANISMNIDIHINSHINFDIYAIKKKVYHAVDSSIRLQFSHQEEVYIPDICRVFLEVYAYWEEETQASLVVY